MASEARQQPTAASALPDAAEVVRLAARAHERDRYLAALLARRDVQGDLVALAAFAGDVGRIPATVSQPMLGEIKLQWWRDAIAHGLQSDPAPTGYPIADAVSVAVRRRGLDPSLLTSVIDAVGTRLEDQPFASLDQLDAHLRRHDGGLFRLACAICGGREQGAAPLLDLAGVAYGLARLLAEAPADLGQGRLLYPADMMAAHGCTVANAHDPQAGPAWGRLRATLVAVAQGRFAAVAEGYQRAPAEVRAAILPVALVKPYLKACERVPMTALVAGDVDPLTRVWRLWMARWRGRV